MLDTVRARFPDLVGYIIFFGAPLSIVLGTVNWRQTPGRAGDAKFSLSGAVVVGGLAGILDGWAFGQWMAKVFCRGSLLPGRTRQPLTLFPY